MGELSYRGITSLTIVPMPVEPRVSKKQRKQAKKQAWQNFRNIKTVEWNIVDEVPSGKPLDWNILQGSKPFGEGTPEKVSSLETLDQSTVHITFNDLPLIDAESDTLEGTDTTLISRVFDEVVGAGGLNTPARNILYPESSPEPLLTEFVLYCNEHPQQRFWQALANFCGYPLFALVSGSPLDVLDIMRQRPNRGKDVILRDTYHSKKRDIS